jgi:hypothetical protein
MSESTSAAIPAVAAAVPVAAAAVSPVAAVAPAPAASPDAATTTPETAISASVLTDPAPDPTKDIQPPETVKPDAPKEGDKPAEEVKPVEYTDFTLPDGLQPENPTLAQFRTDAAELGLTQEQAQGLVTKIGSQMAEAAQAQVATWVQMNTDWQTAIKADTEIGGANFEPMKVSVAKLFDDYVGPQNSPDRKALNEALLLTGAGNNPAIVKAWARIAAAHGEGSHVAGNPPRVAASAADLMYPTHNQAPGAPR